MASQNHNFSGDFLIPSFKDNSNLSATNYSQFIDEKFKNSGAVLVNHNRAEGDHTFNHNTCNGCDKNYPRLKPRNKNDKMIRTVLKDKNIGHNGSIINSTCEQRYENDELSSTSSGTTSPLEEENMKLFNSDQHDLVTDSLKEKYVCLNFEFNQMQSRHGEYAMKPDSQNDENDEAIYSDSSENGLERKYTQVFHHPDPDEESLKAKTLNRQKFQQEIRAENKENLTIAQDNNNELKLILKTLKKIFKSPPAASRDTFELRKLYEIVKTLQEEQEKFRKVVKDQQEQLNNFHSQYVKAQDIIQSQKYEIKQLYSTNKQLENELNTNMNSLKEKFQDKVNEVSHLPRAVKAEKAKCDKLQRENASLVAKLQEAKQELALTKTKLEDASQKRTKARNKLKTSERDLKIFRTQNNIYKTEKRTLFEELRKLKDMNNDLKATSTRSISRQKERGDCELRMLRKKIVDLELELSRSRSSTNALVEERDKLIAELQMQLNTLVHNFEISQKHIRILRRHIYSLSGNQKCPLKSS